jgi:DNA-directed RNA polymerase subunit RPC12/RpoP
VKFSCEGCGKKYATAEAPAPGRVYKIRCKACGHLMIVKAPQPPSAVEAAPAPAPPPERAPEAAPGPAGYVDLFADAPAPEPEKPPEAPFLAAARELLPDDQAAPTSPAAAEAGATGATSRVPVIPKPPQPSSALHWILIAGGAIVLLGILAFVLLRGA